MNRREKVESMLAAAPEDVFLNFALAMEFVKESRFSEAIASFDRTLALDPNYLTAYFQKGRTLLETGAIDEAKQVLRSGIHQAQRSGDSHAAEEMQAFLETIE